MTGTRDRSRSDANWNYQIAEVNDFNTHYVREGHGQPLILLRGWPEFWRGWHRNISALTTRFDVIASDLRGFGDTRARGARPAGPDAHARDIMTFADVLGLDQFGLVAYDVGEHPGDERDRWIGRHPFARARGFRDRCSSKPGDLGLHRCLRERFYPSDDFVHGEACG